MPLPCQRSANLAVDVAHPLPPIKWHRRRAGREELDHSGLLALRHFFATTLITNYADPKEVQRALRYSTLQITLETYVHVWERRRGVVGDVLRAAAERRGTS